MSNMSNLENEHRNISKRVGIVGFYTLLSRIFGLARDVVLAWLFGATRAADAFYVAFRIPNVLRRFVAEGALTVAFVPVYTDYLKKSREEALRAASVIFTYLSLLLTFMVVVGIVFSPWIVKLVAWGFSAEPEKFALTVYLTRIMFPYIFLISLVALAMGILNSLKRFAAPAASPILLNVAIVFAALVLSRFFEVKAVALALGVILGGVCQLLLQVPSLVKEGMLPRFNFDFRHPALRSILLLMIPSAFGAAVYQINILVVTLLASFLPEGSVSYLWYADRISEFSLGIFSISVATVALPTMSDHATANDMESLKKTLNFSLRLAFLIDIPAAAGLFILSNLAVSVLFMRGEFNPSTAAATAAALCMFALKIPFVSGVRNLVPAFFSLKDAKTPVYIAAFTVFVNAVASLLLMGPFLHVGLAASLVISSVVNLFVLIYFFRRKVGALGGKKIVVSITKTLFATLVMSAILYAAKVYFQVDQLDVFWKRAVALVSMLIGGLAIFLAVASVVSREEFQAVKNLVGRKRNH